MASKFAVCTLHYFVEQFANRLKELRTEKNLRQIDLAKKLGFNTHSVIANWESGKQIPDIHNFILIAKFFGVSIDYLVGIEN
jgi:transcriptional regulator with XRE-family HTH domain